MPKVNFKPDYLSPLLAQLMFQLFFVGQPEIDIALKLSDVVYEETEEAKYKVGLVGAFTKIGALYTKHHGYTVIMVIISSINK